MKNGQKGSIAVRLLVLVAIWLVVVVTCGYGYVQNVLAIIHHVGANDNTFIVRIVGLLVVPVGIFMGLFF